MAGKEDKPGVSPAETIFSAALELPPDKRQDYLAAACGNDVELRKWVEALLRAHQAPAGFLPEEHGPMPTEVRMDPDIQPAFMTEQAGDCIGPYKLLQKIGEGGCGVVYMAEQEKPVRRKVALKIIKLGMDTQQVVVRFEAERQALALMEHTNIAKVIDAGATETGRPYFVMELVGGIKITDYCDQHQLTTRERLSLFIQVCRAIQHAHQKGIIHRDIKPSNILVAIQDGIAIPKVIDFGIAKATQGRLTDQTVFTAFEQFLGTPAYMSPEQTQHGSLDVDTRSDIYSLGVLLYELLTGKTPFDSKELLSAGLDSLRRTIQEIEPPTPSTRLKKEIVGDDVRRLDSKSAEEIRVSSRRLLQKKELIRLVRGDLDWIVMKCLEKDRARRYDTANGLAMDIERHMKNQPVVAGPPNTLYLLRKFIRRNRAVTAFGVVLLLGIAGSSWGMVRARQAEREQARLLKEAQAARQDATEKLWSSYLAEVRALKVSGQPGRRFDGLATVRKAAAIHASPALRNEAIACMILPDIRSAGSKDFHKTREKVIADSELARYAIVEKTGGVSVRHISDDREEARLSNVAIPAIGLEGFSPDGKFVVVHYADGHCRFWNWSLPAVALDVGFLTGCCFAPDSRTVGFTDATNIMLHDLTSGKELNRISLDGLSWPGTGNGIYFDPSGQRLALRNSGADTNIVILDVQTGQRLKTLEHPGHVWSFTWHPNGGCLATACSPGLIQIWDPTTGEQIRKWPTETDVSIGFNHEGNRLVSSGWDGYTRLWEFASGRELIGSFGITGRVIGFSPDDLTFGVVDWGGTMLNFFEVTAEQEVRTVYQATEPSGEGGVGPTVDRTGKLLAFRTHEGIALLDFQTGRQISTPRFAKEYGLVGFDVAGQNLLLSRGGGLFQCPVVRSAKVGVPSLGDSVQVSAVTSAFTTPDAWISANGKICAIVENNRCQIFRADTFEKVTETGIQLGMRYSGLSPDGSLFASGAWQRPGVNVWDGRTGTLLKQLPSDSQNSDSIATVIFSPDGRYLVTGSPLEYCFWEVKSWSVARRVSHSVSGYEFWPMMAFSRDGKIFAGTYLRNKIRLHDTATGEALADLEAPTLRTISGLAFNHDGSRLAASESWDSLHVWDLQRIRQKLADLGLDWNQPPYPADDNTSAAQKEPVATRATQSPVGPGH
jgi:serine/threonine protein kinase/WD40 repeat protein